MEAKVEDDYLSLGYQPLFIANRSFRSIRPYVTLGSLSRYFVAEKPKHQAAILCQLRTGICRLNRYLGVIGAASSTQCKCEKGVETVDHFLFRCPLWTEYRQEIRRLAGPRWGDTSYLLGGWSGPQKDGPFEKWKPNTEMINATIKFALSTARLNDNRDEPSTQT